jgi:hypothetical protein
VTFYENSTPISSAQGQYFWLGGHAYSFDVYSLEDSTLLLTMTKRKSISVKSYYQRAKVFGYLALMATVWLLVLYIANKFMK